MILVKWQEPEAQEIAAIASVHLGMVLESAKFAGPKMHVPSPQHHFFFIQNPFEKHVNNDIYKKHEIERVNQDQPK